MRGERADVVDVGDGTAYYLWSRVKLANSLLELEKMTDLIRVLESFQGPFQESAE